eukprot:CAMPEP_0170440008 /NCGR_PEP_ID=MMETSP0117_2-20130122/46095_1 /TAXON_ID=400756 /ORGANISM="Durinskia baltica, Strain CSIRO CS-38" /LENGTH=173 /DNA_ID=CAMNT_0010700381 /DNA_START=51 /DNA_END=568 /DNA_ORIENTATION=-
MSHSLSVSINREKSQETEKKNPLKPGDHFPRVVLHSNCGEDLNLQVSRSRARLIVFFRGSFCNFCEEALLEINCRMDTFERENIDVVAVSADTVQESKDLSTRLGLRFPIACDLTVDQMRTLGLYPPPLHRAMRTARLVAASLPAKAQKNASKCGDVRSANLLISSYVQTILS